MLYFDSAGIKFWMVTSPDHMSCIRGQKHDKVDEEAPAMEIPKGIKSRIYESSVNECERRESMKCFIF